MRRCPELRPLPRAGADCGPNVVELGRDQPAERERSGETDSQAEEDRSHSLAHDEAQDIEVLRAECHADADFARPLFHRVGDRAVDTDRRQEQSHPREDAEQTSS